MGKVISIFRRSPSSEEKLTKLDEQIKDLEGYTVSTRETQRKFAGRFLVASIGTYVIAFVVFYFYFFPPTWKDRLLYTLPLLLFPVVIILLKYCVSWHFNSKIDRNNRRLIQLRKEKRDVLQNVMDKETYKVALEILNTFGDKSMRLKAAGHDLDSSMALNSSQMNASMGGQQGSQLTHRTPMRAPNPNQSNRFNTPSAPTGPGQLVARGGFGGTPAPIGFRAAPLTPQPVRGTALQGTPGIPPLQFQTKKTPFPVIDSRRQNVMEKMMDFIISDGPSNRFAMICSGCCGHNGMALQEDFEYVAFKCAFCGHLNPARKIRPKARGLSPERVAPMLINNNRGIASSSHPNNNQNNNRGSAGDATSSSDDDDEELSQPGVKITAPVAIETQRASDLELNSSEESEADDDGEKKEPSNTEKEVDTSAMDVDDEVKDSQEKKKD